MDYFGDIRIPGVTTLAQSLGSRRIQQADTFQEQVHTRQWRKIVRGPHTDHTRYVAAVYAYFFPNDTDGIISALLHDTVEDAHKLAKSIRRRFKVYYRKQDDKSLHQFLRQNAPPCFLKFLNDIHGLKLYQENRDGSVGPLLPDETIQNPQTIGRLRQILTDDMQKLFPRLTAWWFKIFTFRSMQERFRRFVAQYIHNEFGQDVKQTVYILTRETTHQKFNDAFTDPNTREFIRRRAANIKALDTYHNLETMSLEDPWFEHGKGLIERTIALSPYLEPLLHSYAEEVAKYPKEEDKKLRKPGIKETLRESLEKHYATLQQYHLKHGMAALPPLEERLGAARKDYERAVERLAVSSTPVDFRRFKIDWQRMRTSLDNLRTNVTRKINGLRRYDLH